LESLGLIKLKVKAKKKSTLHVLLSINGLSLVVYMKKRHDTL
jgi:hypothetical protein